MIDASLAMNRRMTEARPREFRARFIRRAPSIAAQRRSVHGTRRIVLLLATAVALPAMAQAHLANDSGHLELAATNSPPTPVRLARDLVTRTGLTFPALPAVLSGTSEAGPSAHALRFAGTVTDRLRAQYCLTAAIYYEAGAEAEAGQRAVAQVVLNRVAHPAFPATVCGVVFQGSERSSGCQFTFTCDGSMARAPARAWWDRAARTARAALAGSVYAPVGLATHYHTVQVHPYWANTLDGVGTIGAHRFYRWRGAAGQPHAFAVRYIGGEPVPSLHGPAMVYDTPAVLGEEDRATATFPAVQVQATLSDGDIVLPADPADGTNSLPGRSGQVRREFESSGRWLKSSASFDNR